MHPDYRRSAPRNSATSKMKLFLAIGNIFQPLTVAKENYISDVTGFLNALLNNAFYFNIHIMPVSSTSDVIIDSI